jgi:hypothetical protein
MERLAPFSICRGCALLDEMKTLKGSLSSQIRQSIRRAGGQSAVSKRLSTSTSIPGPAHTECGRHHQAGGAAALLQPRAAGGFGSGTRQAWRRTELDDGRAVCRGLKTLNHRRIGVLGEESAILEFAPKRAFTLGSGQGWGFQRPRVRTAITQHGLIKVTCVVAAATMTGQDERAYLQRFPDSEGPGAVRMRLERCMPLPSSLSAQMVGGVTGDDGKDYVYALVHGTRSRSERLVQLLYWDSATGETVYPPGGGGRTAEAVSGFTHWLSSIGRHDTPDGLHYIYFAHPYAEHGSTTFACVLDLLSGQVCFLRRGNVGIILVHSLGSLGAVVTYCQDHHVRTVKLGTGEEISSIEVGKRAPLYHRSDRGSA